MVEGMAQNGAIPGRQPAKRLNFDAVDRSCPHSAAIPVTLGAEFTMADSDTARKQRMRRHAAGDHQYCSAERCAGMRELVRKCEACRLARDMIDELRGTGRDISILGKALDGIRADARWNMEAWPEIAAEYQPSILSRLSAKYVLEHVLAHEA
jgi:hypothetical protein